MMRSTEKQIEQIPVSMEACRRKVMKVIHALERETNIFKDRYVTKTGEPELWLPFIEQLQERFGRTTDRMDDFKDVDALLQRAKEDEVVGKDRVFNELRRMVERGKMFDYIAYSLRNDLVDAYENNLQKYCLSFASEARGEDLNSVRDYENRVISWDDEIRERLEHVDRHLDQCDEFKTSLKKYVEDYEKVLDLMKETCNAMIEACEPMKRWAVSDSTYPRRIQEEINVYNRKKMELSDVAKQLEYQRDQQGLRLRRKAFHTLKLERTLQEAREEKTYLRRREKTVRENIMKTEADIDRKRRDINEIRARIKNRQENSPAVYNYLTGLAESVRDDVHVLEGKMDTFAEQRGRLLQQQDEAQREIDRLQNEVDSTQGQHEIVTERLMREDGDIRHVKQEITQLESKVDTLKRIREIKQDSDTLKKIHHYECNPGYMRNNSDELSSAFKIASTDLGKDWTGLYQKLPFIPSRDRRERTRDLEVIDLSNRRTDAGFEQLAMKSLEKWRRLSSAASVEELIETLRKMKKRRTVRRIERELLQPTAATYAEQ